MQQKGTTIPSQITIFEDTIFTIQSDSYALNALNGSLISTAISITAASDEMIITHQTNDNE